MTQNTIPTEDRDLCRDRANDHDRDLVAILMTAQPYPGKNDRESKYMSAYRLARTIRDHEGTLEDRNAELDSRWEAPVYEWSSTNGLDGEEIAELLYGLWEDTTGADRSPFHRALQAWCNDPEIEGIGISPTARRAAAFCYHLQQAVGRGAFYLSCRTLGAILKVTHTRAADILKALWHKSVIRLVAEADFARRLARQWVFDTKEAEGFTHSHINTDTQEHIHPLDSCPLNPEGPDLQTPTAEPAIAPRSRGIEATACAFVLDADREEKGGGGTASQVEEQDREVYDRTQAMREAAIDRALQALQEPAPRRTANTPQRREPSQPTGIESIFAGMAFHVAPGDENGNAERVEDAPEAEAAPNWDPLTEVRPEWTLMVKQNYVAKACKAKGLDKHQTRRHTARLLCHAMNVKPEPIAITRVLTVYDRVKSWAAVAKAALSLSGEATESKRLAWLEYRARAQAGMSS